MNDSEVECSSARRISSADRPTSRLRLVLRDKLAAKRIIQENQQIPVKRAVLQHVTERCP